MKVIGLTGGIASGKTTVANLLAEHGGAVIDADVVAREVVEPGTPGLAAIARAFGPEVIDPAGRLDRAALGKRVFADEAERERLNSIVHPAVKEAMTRALADLARRVPPPPFAVLVIPLLFETGMQAMADTVWTLSVPPELQRERLLSRDALSPQEADARIASQWPLSRKLELSDRVIDNTGLPEALDAQVAAALRLEGLE
ncbi:MAG TPA: dephospho-CoA kinase [Pantanalinema sp.]